MTFVAFNDGQTIFKQGSSGTFIYILASGAIHLTSSNRQPITIDKRGECLGHLALEGKSKRTATLKTTQPTKFWVLEGSFFHECLEQHRQQNKGKYLEHINKIEIFSVLNQEEKEHLAANATKNRFQAGSMIVREGDAGDLLYVIIKGQAQVSQKEVVKRVIGPGDFFGDQAVLYNIVRTASVTALDDLT